MSKRYNFNVKQSVSKKPKLEISIISSQSATTSTTTCRNNFPSKYFEIHSNFVFNVIFLETPEPQSQSNNCLWDDDDDGDELILLASQQIENLDITYTAFQSDVRASTQRPVTPPQNEVGDWDKFFDDDDDAFPNLTNFVGTAGVNIDNEINAVDNFDSEPASSQFNNFKMPTVTSRLSQVPGTSKTALQNNVGKPSQVVPAPYTSKKDRDNTVHVNRLQNSLEKVTKEHKKLQTDFSEITNKIQTKDGENSMLRYELNIIKKQNEQYRLAKIQENDHVKREWLEKIKILEKALKAKETAMEFQNIEMTNMKNRKLNDTIRNLDSTTSDVKEDFSKFHSIFQLNIPTYCEKPSKIVINPFIFKESETDMNGKFRVCTSIKDSIHLKNLKSCQSILAQVIADNNSRFFGDSMLISNISTFKELRDYSLHMEYSKYTDLQSNPRMEHNFLCEMSVPEYELFKEANIFTNE